MARVLHIEDEASNRLLVRKLLESAGHEVMDTDSGLDGVRLAAHHKPDLILVDINIPDLDGYEVTLRLRGIPHMVGVPIVAITAEGDKETTLAVGADGFIAKPIDARGFPSEVARFLGGHTERRDSDTDELLRVRSQKIVARLESKALELSQANRKLEESARLRHEFFQNLSHEFATPMTPVRGYLKLLMDEELGPLTPLQHKCLTSVHSSTEKLRGLIDTLLDVSHLETGRLQLYEREYDFAKVVERAVAEATPRFNEAGVNLIGPDLPKELPGRGDPDKLRRAMVHILDNAAKFTPRGNDVAIGVSTGVLDGSPSRTFEFVVADSGRGITATDRERIMQPFFQVDGSATRKVGGVGLGLAYARHVAEALGGGIEVQSPPLMPVAGRQLSGTAVILTVCQTIGTPDADS